MSCYFLGWNGEALYARKYYMFLMCTKVVEHITVLPWIEELNIVLLLLEDQSKFRVCFENEDKSKNSKTMHCIILAHQVVFVSQ